MLLGTEDGRAIMDIFDRLGGGAITQTVDAIRVVKLKDDERVKVLQAHRFNDSACMAEGENGITFWAMHGAVWCVRSTTQCDYCGSLDSFVMPKHARYTKEWETRFPSRAKPKKEGTTNA